MKVTSVVFSIINGAKLWSEISTKSLGLNAYNVLKRKANTNDIAILDVVSDKYISYKSLLESTCKLSVWLKQNDCKPNDMISICSENNLNFFTPTIASYYSGTIIAGINHTYSEGELKHALDLVQPKIAFCSELTYDKFHSLYKAKEIPYVKSIVTLESLDAMLKDIDCDVNNFQPVDVVDVQDQTAVILYSSGTTGLPKGVMLTHYNINARQNQAENPNQVVSRFDSNILILPFYHAFGYMVGTSVLLKGNTLKFMPKFEENAYLANIEKHKMDCMVAAPPLLVFLAKSPLVDNYDLSSLKYILCGAAPLRKDIEDAVKARVGVKEIYQAYGMTEVTLCAVGFEENDPPKPGSSGKVVPGAMIKIRDVENGSILGANQVGEVCVKGPIVMKGYYKNPDADKITFTDDGWLRTGDLGYYDKDGFFYIVDRLKELIKYKGFQVAPAELEAILLTHPQIMDSGVVGLPDEKAGELPVAFVVRKQGADLSENDVLEFIANQVSRAKRLHYVKFVDAIPKNPSGKILRKELKAMLKNIN